MECPLFNTVTFHDRNLHQALKTENLKIYKKDMLSNYQKAINDASCELPIQDPSLLTRRGDQLNFV